MRTSIVMVLGLVIKIDGKLRVFVTMPRVAHLGPIQSSSASWDIWSQVAGVFALSIRIRNHMRSQWLLPTFLLHMQINTHIKFACKHQIRYCNHQRQQLGITTRSLQGKKKSEITRKMRSITNFTSLLNQICVPCKSGCIRQQNQMNCLSAVVRTRRQQVSSRRCWLIQVVMLYK